VQCHTPLLYPYLYQCYRNPSTLFFGDHLISSSVGAQEGNPCGPMIFTLAIQPIILSLDFQLNIWYLDDATLADYPKVVLSDFKKVIIKTNIPDTIANIKQKSLHGRYFKELE
jgi:hypothetical protein